MKESYLIGIMIVLLFGMVAIGLPFLFESGENTDRQIELLQHQEETIDIHGYLTSEIMDIQTDSVEVRLSDTQTGETSDILTLNESDNQIISFDGGDINLTINQINNPRNEVHIRYNYNQLYGWTEGEQYLLTLIRIVLVFLFLIIIVFVLTALLSEDNGGND